MGVGRWRFERALLGRVGWIAHEGRAWAQLDAACGGKGGDVEHWRCEDRTWEGCRCRCKLGGDGMAGGHGRRQERRVCV